MKGDERSARTRLYGIAPRPSVWIMFLTGATVGLFAAFVLAIALVWTHSVDFSSNAYFKAAFPVFRGVALVAIFIWCWGLVVFFYEKYRYRRRRQPCAVAHARARSQVDRPCADWCADGVSPLPSASRCCSISYLFIMNADPGTHVSFSQIWTFSSALTVLLFAALILFGLSVWSEYGGPPFLRTYLSHRVVAGHGLHA
jgi:hypothetical protein